MIRQLVIAGDSFPQGSTFTIGEGGQGSFAELVAERLANIVGVGPSLSRGLRGCWNAYIGVPMEWSFTTGGNAWTAVVSTDAWDRCPYGGGVTVQGSRYANGSGKVATWTRSTKNRAVVGFYLYWIDYTNGGNWSYRIDGGSWTAMGQTIQNNNALKRFYVSAAVSSTVEIRAADTAGTGVGCCPVGIEPFHSTATDGLIVHKIAIGGSKLHELTLPIGSGIGGTTTAGDRMAIFDLIAPNMGVINMSINDVLLADTAVYDTDLNALNDRVSPFGPVGLINAYGVATATYNDTQQTNYRAQLKTSAAGFATPAKVLDIFDQWNANGWGSTNALQSSIGMTDNRVGSDGIHPKQAGHLDIATRVYWWVRNNFFDVGNAPSVYTATGKRASVAYSGKLASVAYSAGAPISVG